MLSNLDDDHHEGIKRNHAIKNDFGGIFRIRFFFMFPSTRRSSSINNNDVNHQDHKNLKVTSFKSFLTLLSSHKDHQNSIETIMFRFFFFVVFVSWIQTRLSSVIHGKNQSIWIPFGWGAAQIESAFKRHSFLRLFCFVGFSSFLFDDFRQLNYTIFTFKQHRQQPKVPGESERHANYFSRELPDSMVVGHANSLVSLSLVVDNTQGTVTTTAGRRAICLRARMSFGRYRIVVVATDDRLWRTCGYYQSTVTSATIPKYLVGCLVGDEKNGLGRT